MSNLSSLDLAAIRAMVYEATLVAKHGDCAMDDMSGGDEWIAPFTAI